MIAMPLIVTRTVLAAALVALSATVVTAQTARTRYENALARETRVREALANAADQAEASQVATDAAATMASYEAIVARYPISGYSDNALFNAASLADLLHQRFGHARDRAAAVRLYGRVGREYPASSLTARANEALARLQAAATIEPAAAVTQPVSVSSAVPTPAAGRARLTGIDRVVLPDIVRITIALDREVAYHEETLDGPRRVFFDLRGVEAAPALGDAVLRYPTDAVRQIRVGRHPNSTVRVVLDLAGVTRHSVYTLYNPFRLVIDCEPAAPTSVRTADSGLTPPPNPARTDTKPALPTTTSAVVIRSPEPVIASVLTPPPPEPSTAVVAAKPTVPPNTPVTTAPATPAPRAPRANGAGGFSLARQLGLGVSRIVIDPGHGGHDPGAQARGVSEADLTLDIALKLEALLLAEPGIDVILTRRTDEYIPLEERTAIANREGADLFLSIHANTSRNTAASGIETYFLSFAGTPDAEAVAARENSAHEGEMHRLPDMIKAIALNNKLDESRDLAGMVQESLVARLRRSNKTAVNRGVKKAPFVVLIGAEMPSVLAEVSFLTNRQEAQLLKTPAYKQRIAEALHAAVMRYRRSLKSAAAVAASQ
jgi:N-acetylmuramoyl-L-alanine amidase